MSSNETATARQKDGWRIGGAGTEGRARRQIFRVSSKNAEIMIIIFVLSVKT